LAEKKRVSSKLYASVGHASEPSLIEVRFADSAAFWRRVWPAPSLSPAELTPPELEMREHFASARVYTFDADAIARPVQLQRTFLLQPNGLGLAAVLTNLQDQHPERFEELNVELRRWMPEFNRILFDTPQTGERAFMLRTTHGHHAIAAAKLSHGVLFALAMLTLAHLPNPPRLIGLEEPDRGIHPRLLRDVQDAIIRLTDPAAFGDKRDPVQVVITTHSPYLIDLFRDRLEDIVIAQKHGLFATFSRLVDQPNVEEIIKDAHLGEIWYSGILGGVPAGT
jgi:predicted ATPase